MRIMTRSLPPALAAALVVLFAIACNSGGDSDQARSDQPADQTDGQTVADDGSGDSASTRAMKVLSASAESFQQDVESLQIEMEFTTNAGGLDMDMNADMAFRAPDEIHMTADITGLGTFEMLMLGTDIYMNIPPQGWVVLSMEDMLGGTGFDGLGVDSGSFQDAFSDHSFVDYEALIEGLGGDIEDLGEETLDGGTYRHYRGTLDFADVAATFSDAFGVTEGLDMEDMSGPLTFDVWVDPDTLLPHKLVASGELGFGADAMVFDASMRFFGYNEPVEIPAPPEDAASFADLLAGLFQQE